MACGNGKVSRDYLSSAPTNLATLFIRAHVGQPSARAVQDPGVVVRLPPAPRSKEWGGKDEQMFYSRSRTTPNPAFKAGTENRLERASLLSGEEEDVSKQRTVAKTDYFVGADGNPTVDPNRHIHVIHDEQKQEVILVLTDRTQQSKNEHLLEVTLPGNPSGNQVNKAIDAMVATLNQIPRGPKSVQWL